MRTSRFWVVLVICVSVWFFAGLSPNACEAAGTDVVDLTQVPGAGQAPAQSSSSWRQQNIDPIIQLLKQQADKLEALDAKYPGLFTSQAARLRGEISLLESSKINIGPTWTNLTTFGEWFKFHFVETDAKAYVWPGTSSIWIYEKNFNTLTPEEKASVLLHELVHIKGGGEKEAYTRQYEYLRLIGKTDEPGRGLSTEMVNVLDNLAQLGVIPKTQSYSEPFKKDGLDRSLGLDVLYPIVKNGLDAALAAKPPSGSSGGQQVPPPSEAFPPAWSPAFAQVQYTGHSFGPWDESQLYSTPREAALGGLRGYIKGFSSSGTKYYTEKGNLACWSDPVELWQSGKLVDGYTVYTFGTTFTPPLWDGSSIQEAEDRMLIEGGAGSSALLIYVQSVPREVQGKPTAYTCCGFFEYVPNRPPVVEEITCEGVLQRGQTAVLHARTSDPDNDTVLVRWYVQAFRGGNVEWRHLGDGRDLTWSIPADLYGCDSLGSVRAYAVDSKGGIARGEKGINLSAEKEYPDIESITQSPDPVDAGSPVTLCARVRTRIPGSLRAVWTVNGTPVPDGPVKSLGFDRVREAYYYEVQCTLTADRGASSGTLKVENTVNGVLVGESYPNSFQIRFTDRDLIEKAAGEKQNQLVEAEALLSNVRTRAGELKAAAQLFQQFNPYQIAGQLVDANARLQHYLRWRAGLEKAGEGWGYNYTVSLLHASLDELLKCLKDLAPALGVDGGAEAAGALSYSDYSEETLKIKLAAAVRALPAVSALHERAVGHVHEVQRLWGQLLKAQELAPDQNAGEVARLGTVLAELGNVPVYPNGELIQEALSGLRDGAARLGLAVNTEPKVPAAGSDEVTIVVNNRVIRPDVPARIISGRTMVPVRFVAEALNCEVDWDGATETVIITSPGNYRAAPPANESGQIHILVNGRLVYPDVAPLLINDRTMVPVRFVAEALGAVVDWDGATRTVTITGALF